MTTRRAKILAFALVFFGYASFSSASATRTKTLRSAGSLAGPRETQLWHSPLQDHLQFALVTHSSSRSQCEADRPPEALATPDPLMDGTDGARRITVSFIVGTDGRVHSPFILDSAGTNEDRTVLQAVQHWRYRPALCNGVPTEVEAKIEFSSR